MLALLGLLLSLKAVGGPEVPDHQDNALYTSVRANGLSIPGATDRLPDPTFADGQSADEQRAALLALTGSERSLEAFLRNSVTAPFALKVRDVDGTDATIRAGDLYFVLHVALEDLETDDLNRSGSSGPVEAGNMRFEARLLDSADLPEALAADLAPGARVVRAVGRLLDRVALETTTVLVGSRSDESLVVASGTDPRFDRYPELANRWHTIERQGARESAGPSQPYAGGINYTKVTRLAGVPGAVIVESHFAFVEPRAWFNGAPILRSKFSLVAQDQVRRLRRELQRAAAGSESR
jgi:hypothetical protein